MQTLQSQATDKVRSFASDGKEKATSALNDLSQVVNEAAQTIEERLGPQYADYARRAATAVSGFADNLQEKDVDDLFDDAREIVRKSPGVAIGAAAVIGFGLVRLIKAGMDDQNSSKIDFRPDASLGSSTGSSSIGGGTSGSSSLGGSTTGSSSLGGSSTSYGTGTGFGSSDIGSTTGSQAPYVAPTTGA